MTQVLIDRVTLEQALDALNDTTGLPSTGARSFDNRIMSIRALRAALANAERVEPDTQLCKFYDVATYPDLVAAMEKHITKLQARTPPLTGEAFTQEPRFA